MLPLIDVKVDFTMDNNRVTVEGGGYKITFDKESIQRAEMLDTMPRDNFTKPTARHRNLCGRAFLKGITSENVCFLIYKGNAPYILIQTDTQTMFFKCQKTAV